MPQHVNFLFCVLLLFYTYAGFIQMWPDSLSAVLMWMIVCNAWLSARKGANYKSEYYFMNAHLLLSLYFLCGLCLVFEGPATRFWCTLAAIAVDYIFWNFSFLASQYQKGVLTGRTAANTIIRYAKYLFALFGVACLNIYTASLYWAESTITYEKWMFGYVPWMVVLLIWNYDKVKAMLAAKD